jgi:MSHA biogenesis protein MshM
MLISQLPENIGLVYLPNPVLSGEGLRSAIAKELGIKGVEPNMMVDAIQEKLLEISLFGKQIVALIDEAQALSDEALETLRLFGNLETENQKLLQIVLFGQPELDQRLEANHMRQFRQRITFNAKLRPLTISEGCAYIQHRVEMSGGEKSLFSLSQKKAIWKASRGIPRLINQICHKSLILTYGKSDKRIQNQYIYDAIQDTYDALKPKYRIPTLWGWR